MHDLSLVQSLPFGSRKKKWVVFAVLKVICTFWNLVWAVCQLLYFWSTVFESFCHLSNVPECYCSKYLYCPVKSAWFWGEKLFKLDSGSTKRIKNKLAYWVCVHISICNGISFFSLDNNVLCMLFWLKYITDF